MRLKMKMFREIAPTALQKLWVAKGKALRLASNQPEGSYCGGEHQICSASDFTPVADRGCEVFALHRISRDAVPVADCRVSAGIRNRECAVTHGQTPQNILSRPADEPEPRPRNDQMFQANDSCRPQ